MDTRSGELLSAVVALVLGCTALLNQQSYMFLLLTRADAFPEWAILSVTCSVISFLCVLINNAKYLALGRFLSGCVWGTILLLSISIEYYGALLWISVIFFAYDIISVMTKGNLRWKSKNHSPTQGT